MYVALSFGTNSLKSQDGMPIIFEVMSAQLQLHKTMGLQPGSRHIPVYTSLHIGLHEQHYGLARMAQGF